MTRKRPQEGGGRAYSRHLPPACRAVLIMALSGVIMASAGCGSPPAHVRLPARAVTPAGIIPTATVSKPALMTAREQVLATLVGYTSALGRAEDSRSGAVARELLRPYLTVGRVDGLVQAMTAIWARHESFTGHDIRHVSSVTMTGQRAFIHDCDNTSGMSLLDAVTGQILPGSSGTRRVNIVTRLDLVAGHWLVQFQLVEDVPCVP